MARVVSGWFVVSRAATLNFPTPLAIGTGDGIEGDMHRFEAGVDQLAKGLAGFGGAILIATALMVCASVIGRALPGLSGVPGDFELIEMAAAIGVFSFLPLCQLRGGQVSIDIVSVRFPQRIHSSLGLLGHLVLTAVSCVLLWRFWLGFGEKLPLGSDTFRAFLMLGDPPYFTETTYELLIPVWVPHALCLPGAIVLVLAGCVCCARALREVTA